MKSYSGILYIFILLSLSVLSAVAVCFGALPAPSGGWIGKYEANKKVLPQHSWLRWINYYKPNQARICNDEITGEQVLRLNHTGSGDYENQYYMLRSPKLKDIFIGSKMTIEIRFRLTDEKEQRAQLTFSVTCPTLSGNRNFAYLLRFARDGFFYDTRAGYPKYRYDFGTKWHIVRLVIDTQKDKADLYIDGRVVLDGIRGVAVKRQCAIKVGDGSSWVRGQVNISYIRWTDKELVPSIIVRKGETISLEQIRAERKKLAHRKRRIIMNSDDGDMTLVGLIQPVFTPNRAPTADEFLDSRYSGLKDSQVDAIFYYWRPDKEVLNFGNFTYLDVKDSIQERSNLLKKGPARASWRVIRKISKLWDSALDILIEFGHKNGKEIFWSCRMNDTHDAFAPELFNQWKKDNPECLMGRKGDKFPYGGGRWSAVNYEMSKVRNRMYQIFKRICTKHDIDGIEMDFYRHPIYFKNQMFGKPVTDRQRNIMTGFIRKVRRMTEQVSVARCRPVLVAVRVPDSVEYCKAIGLDIDRWLAEGLIDIMTVGGYYHFQPWENSVSLGDKYDVPVYACLSASLIGYSMNDWRAEAIRAWKAGVSGIYIFNIFDPYSIRFRELGSLRTIKGTDKGYKPKWHSWYMPEDKGYWLKDEYLYVWLVRIAPHLRLFDSAITVKMRFPSKKVSIHYTLDGSEPNINSLTYTHPITIDKTVTIKSAAFFPDGRMACLYTTKAKFVRVKKIYNPKSKLPLKMFGKPVGTKGAIKFDLPNISSDNLYLYLTMNDVDSMREVRVFINGSGPFVLPKEILSPSGTKSAFMQVSPKVFRAGDNIITFEFSDNLRNTTSGFSVEQIKLVVK